MNFIKEKYYTVISVFRLPRFSLFFLLWHFSLCLLTGFNWRYFLSGETSLLGPQLPRVYISFCLTGFVLFITLGSTLVYWPYRYAAFMLPDNRRNKFYYGLGIIYMTHILPCWVMELSIAWQYGIFTLLQGACFILLTMSWMVDTTLLWWFYTCMTADFVHRNYGHTNIARGHSKIPPDE